MAEKPDSADSRMAIHGELVHLHTVEYRVMVRVLLARGRVDEALGILDKIEAAAREAQQRLLLVEALILRGIGLMQQGKEQEAVSVMGEAVKSAEPEGYVRPFLPTRCSSPSARHAPTSATSTASSTHVAALTLSPAPVNSISLTIN